MQSPMPRMVKSAILQRRCQGWLNCWKGPNAAVTAVAHVIEVRSPLIVPALVHYPRSGCAQTVSATLAPLAPHTSLVQDIQNWALQWEPVVGILFFTAIIFILWRTLKVMPRVKPQQIKPTSKQAVSFADIAGVDEAKAELQEIVEFLREPKPFQALGAKVPKGILLHGPPGTGKTLLAKAVAHESGAQFFAQSAASFVEMFAGPARRASAGCSRSPASTNRRSSSSTSSTPSGGGAAWTSPERRTRRSTSCWSRWTASPRAAASW